MLCKIHRKAASVKELEQRAAEAESAATGSFDDNLGRVILPVASCDGDATFLDHPVAVAAPPTRSASSIRRPAILPELDVPEQNGLEWLQDPFLTQLRSPWLMDFWSPSIASILHC